MKRLSDYKGEEAIELWADIFDTVTLLVSDEEVRKYTTGKGIDVQKASRTILKKYPKEIFSLLSRIDDDEITGANAYTKLVLFVTEITLGDSARTFFKSAEQEKSDKESSGSAMENTEDGET